MDHERFAARTLLAARRRAEFSQRSLAAAAGVPASVLSAYETGARQPSAAMLARLVSAAGGTLGLVDVAADRLRQARTLELVVGMASQLPQRPPGELRYPSFRDLNV